MGVHALAAAPTGSLPSARPTGFRGRGCDALRRLVFLLALTALFVLLPIRHVGLQQQRTTTGLSASHARIPVAVEDGGDDISVASDDLTARPASIAEGTRAGPAAAEGVSPARQALLKDLGIRISALPQSRFGPSVRQPAQLTPEEAGGVYRNPHPPMNRTRRPCLGGLHTRGRWRYDATRRAPYPGVGEILGSCQRGYERQHGRGAQRPETRYRWVPDECDLIPFSEEAFCRALRGRDLMLAGDSLNDHWHASLAYLLGVSRGRDIYRREGTTAGKHACRGHPICAKYYPRPLRLFFLTNQLLEQKAGRNRNHNWWKYIHQYSLLVLNSGSWMRDPLDENREVSDDEWQRHMQHALKLVRALFNGTVVWRTTYQGHPNCWEYTAPLTEELAATDFPSVAPYKRYRWAAIPGRNNFSTSLWRGAGAHILDITRPTNLMPLGHLGKNHPKFALRNTTDCLHYCAPGPYDLWSELLMNLLLGNIDG